MTTQNRKYLLTEEAKGKKNCFVFTQRFCGFFFGRNVASQNSRSISSHFFYQQMSGEPFSTYYQQRNNELLGFPKRAHREFLL